MSSEVFIFRLADGKSLNDFSSSESEGIIYKLIPQLRQEGADYVCWGQLTTVWPEFGIILVGWMDDRCADENAEIRE